MNRRNRWASSASKRHRRSSRKQRNVTSCYYQVILLEQTRREGHFLQLRQASQSDQSRDITPAPSHQLHMKLYDPDNDPSSGVSEFEYEDPLQPRRPWKPAPTGVRKVAKQPASPPSAPKVKEPKEPKPKRTQSQRNFAKLRLCEFCGATQSPACECRLRRFERDA
jgi:hypothetical protein